MAGKALAKDCKFHGEICIPFVVVLDIIATINDVLQVS